MAEGKFDVGRVLVCTGRYLGVSTRQRPSRRSVCFVLIANISSGGGDFEPESRQQSGVAGRRRVLGMGDTSDRRQMGGQIPGVT